MKLGLSFFLLGNLLDMVTTHIGLSRGYMEANPLAAALGEPGMYLFKALLAAWLCVYLWRYGKPWAFWFASALVSIAVINNVWRLS